jgi:hypothetical protein
MRNPKSSHAVNCDVETFWKIFLDEEYNRALIMDELQFKSREVLEASDTVRRMKIVPKMNMPAPVVKLLGDSFGYEESGKLDRDKNVWTWTMQPNTMQGKLMTSGSVRIEPIGDDKCRRTDEASIEAKVFGVGKLIESSAEKEVIAAWRVEERFFKRWLDDQKSSS